jgi:hypothetical protein
MARSLLVFIGSPAVGSYINAMANSVEKYEVDDIALIKVVGSPSQGEIDADTVNQTLIDTVYGLVDGIYRELDQKALAYRESPAPKAKNCDAYKKLKNIFRDSYHVKKVNHQLLRENIEKLKDIYGANAIIDVSGATKKDAIDVLTACLAVGMRYVMLFELNKPPRGEATLYHNLKETDYEHVILPDWEPLVANIEFFAARQNRSKLTRALISILLSIGLILAYQLVRVGFGEENWFTWILVIAIAATGLFGGVTPLMDVWGGLGLVLSFGRRKKI